MFKRILVPLDGSAESAQSLSYAKLVAKATGARMDLFESSPGLDALMRGMLTDDSVGTSTTVLSYEQWQDVQRQFKQAAQNNLESVAQGLQAEGFTVKTTVGEGDPAEAIVSEAGREPDTLIAMSTHGRSGIGRWNMGSVTDKVVRSGNHPTLVIRSRKEARPAALRGIVLPLDRSDLSASAIPYAIGLAKALGVGIHVLHVFQTPFFQTSDYSQPEMLLQEVRAAEQRGQDYVRGVSDRMRGEGVKDVSDSAFSGDPASAILDAVGEAGDRLVVMSTHGRSGIQRVLLGSVTDKTVRNSHGPVLVVRPKRD